MRLMFAQTGPGGIPAQPTQHEFLVWMAMAVMVIAGVAFLVTLFNQAAKARSIMNGTSRQAEIKPQPFDVRITHDLVRKEDCMARHNESMTGLATVQKDIEELKRQRSLDTDALHEKVNKVGREVSELKSTTAMQNQQLARMDSKLDRLVERRLEAI